LEYAHLGNSDCEESDQAELRQFLNWRLRFDHAEDLARSTPRIALAGPLSNMTDIQLELRSYKTRSRCNALFLSLMAWVDASVGMMSAFLGDREATAERLAGEAIEAWFDFVSGLNRAFIHAGIGDELP
jgi:hypothetical protein